MSENRLNSVDFKQVQQNFAAYIRNPLKNTAPAGVKRERIAIYRELFFSNIESFLSANFPVLKSLVSEDDWLVLAQDFYSTHHCSTPYFSEIPEEFLDYLQNERDNVNDFPFMLELAHYEWVEMALSISTDEHPVPNIQQNNDLLAIKLELSPLAWPLLYQYPVHKISPDFIPNEKPDQATFLVVYRDISDEVKFLETTAMAYNLITVVEQTPHLSGQDYLQRILQNFENTIDQTFFFDQGMKALSQLIKLNILTTQ